MINRVSIVAAAGLLIVGLTSLSAEAQAQKPAPEPKGVKVTGLVSSLGGFSATVTTPLLLVGTQGVQYHAAGQSFMDNGGWWHNHMNSSPKPVKYLMIHLGYPGRPDPIQKQAKDD